MSSNRPLPPGMKPEVYDYLKKREEELTGDARLEHLQDVSGTFLDRSAKWLDPSAKKPEFSKMPGKANLIDPLVQAHVKKQMEPKKAAPKKTYQYKKVPKAGEDGKFEWVAFDPEDPTVTIPTGQAAAESKTMEQILAEHEAKKRTGLETEDAFEAGQAEKGKPYKQRVMELSGEQLKRLELNQAGLSSALELKQLFKDGKAGRFQRLGLFQNDFNRIANEWKDAISRLRSGAALTEEEVKFYSSMIPTAVDWNDEVSVKKLETAINNMANGLQNLGFDPKEAYDAYRGASKSFSSSDFDGETKKDDKDRDGGKTIKLQKHDEAGNPVGKPKNYEVGSDPAIDARIGKDLKEVP